MAEKDVFSVNVPTASAATAERAEEVIVADGCENNTNYYTQGIDRGTCCCGCDKDAVAVFE